MRVGHAQAWTGCGQDISADAARKRRRKQNAEGSETQAERTRGQIAEAQGARGCKAHGVGPNIGGTQARRGQDMGAAKGAQRHKCMRGGWLARGAYLKERGAKSSCRTATRQAAIESLESSTSMVT